MSWFPALKDLQSTGYVTPEELNVTPALLGQPLASPKRRLYAMLIDLLAVAVLSSLAGAAGLWFFTGAIGAWLIIRRWPYGHSRARQGWAAALLIALLALCGTGTWSAMQDAARDGAIIKEKLGRRESTAGEEEMARVQKHLSDTARIAVLEQQLAEARKPKDFDVRAALHDAVGALGLSFSWAVLYFTLLPCWWKGQTLGKKMLRLRVVELTGKPLTLIRCFGRYGGYAAGLATGLLGFAQIYWDANRQAVQDKIAHTVVIKL